MKTLDEVIKGVETYKNIFAEKGCFDCHYRDEDCINSCFLEDALHYLKEYRSDMKLWESDRKGFEAWIEQYKEARDKHQQAVIDMAKNPPLTWDELKAMEGKPVWVEQRYQKMWGLNDGTYLDAFGDDCITIKVLHDLCHFEKKLIGITWQAYRKER